MRVFFEALMMFFIVGRFWVERSKESLRTCRVVVGLQMCERVDERVAKEILEWFVCGGTQASTMEGRTVFTKRSTFDSTMGYPGEDVQL